MKKSICIVTICMLLFAACDKVAKTNAPTPTTDTTQKSGVSTAKDLSFLLGLNAKYPSNIKLFEADNVLSLRVKKLLGDAEYADFQQRMVVQMPITVADKTVFMSACMPHSCTFEEAAIAIDIATDKIWVCLLKDGKISTKTDGDMATAPLLFTNYIKENTKK